MTPEQEFWFRAGQIDVLLKLLGGVTMLFGMLLAGFAVGLIHQLWKKYGKKKVRESPLE